MAFERDVSDGMVEREAEVDGFDEFFTCEYCVGCGCKTCGYTGRKLHPVTGEFWTDADLERPS